MSEQPHIGFSSLRQFAERVQRPERMGRVSEPRGARKRRELRYSGPRCQWVIGPELIGLWTGNMHDVLAIPRTVVELRPGPALDALLGRTDDRAW